MEEDLWWIAPLLQEGSFSDANPGIWGHHSRPSSKLISVLKVVREDVSGWWEVDGEGSKVVEEMLPDDAAPFR